MTDGTPMPNVDPEPTQLAPGRPGTGLLPKDPPIAPAQVYDPTKLQWSDAPPPTPDWKTPVFWLTAVPITLGAFVTAQVFASDSLAGRLTAAITMACNGLVYILVRGHVRGTR